jgi:hypothetical protein
MFQESEIINLISGFVSVLLIRLIFMKKEMPRFRFLYAAFFCIISGYIFTILEGIGWHAFFNILEHCSYAAAGLLFFISARSMRASPATMQESEHA